MTNKEIAVRLGHLIVPFIKTPLRDFGNVQDIEFRNINKGEESQILLKSLYKLSVELWKEVKDGEDIHARSA